MFLKELLLVGSVCFCLIGDVFVIKFVVVFLFSFIIGEDVPFEFLIISFFGSNLCFFLFWLLMELIDLDLLCIILLDVFTLFVMSIILGFSIFISLLLVFDIFAIVYYVICVF